MKERVRVYLDTEADADIIFWLQGQSNKSAAIRAAIRASWGEGVTLASILEEVREIKRILRAGVMPPHTERSADEAPEVGIAQAALDNLGG